MGEPWLSVTILNLTTLFIVTLVIVFQLCSLCRVYLSPINAASARYYSMIFFILLILIANWLNLILGLAIHLAFPSCAICDWGYLPARILYVIRVFANYIFYVQRAEVAQGMNPALPPKCFKIYLPILFTLIFLGYVGLFITEIGAHTGDGECLTYNSHKNSVFNVHNRHYCEKKEVSVSVASIDYLIGAVIDLIITLFFMYLFIKPLWEILRKQRIAKDYHVSVLSPFKSIAPTYSNIRLIRALKINVALTLVNLVSTNMVILFYSLYGSTLWFIPNLDYCINSCTVFYMLGRNRRWTKKFWQYLCCGYCCCFCLFKKHIKELNDSTKSMNAEEYESDDLRKSTSEQKQQDEENVSLMSLHSSIINQIKENMNDNLNKIDEQEFSFEETLNINSTPKQNIINRQNE